MILLVAGLALIVVALVAKYDRTMPTWLRAAIMVAVVVVVALGVLLALAAL